MHIEIGGFFGGSTSVSVRLQEGHISYSVSTTELFGTTIDSVNVPKKISDAWLTSLAKLQIKRWQGDYSPDFAICDGTQWRLEYKEIGKQCRHISGDNAYPPNWDDFIEVMDRLAPEAALIDAEQLEHIELNYHRLRQMNPESTAPNIPSNFIGDYSEKLIIYRKTETLTYKKGIGSGCLVTHEYYVRDGVRDLLDNCESYFEEFNFTATNSDDKTPRLSIELTRHNGNQTIKCYYNRHGLPDEWEELINYLTPFFVILRFVRGII